MFATAHDPARASTSRRRPWRTKLAALGALTLAGTALFPAGTSMAATAVGLGTAESFGVLGAGTVTNTGSTVVNGDLGVSPGDAVTGFDGGPGTVNGTIHAGDATAAGAQADAGTAYDALAEQGCDADLSGQDLGGLTLTPGVYCFSSSAQLTGPLTLNAVGDPDAVFIFRIGTALTTASSSSVVFTDDFESCNVFWQAGTAATLGTDTAFVGTLITQTEAITANTGATVLGRLIALNAAVTLDDNVVTATSCAADDDPSDDAPTDDDPSDDPSDDAPADDEPTDGTPGDGTPGDGTPGDGTPGDGTPGDGSQPELPFTGSSGMLASLTVLAVLAVLAGGRLVVMADQSSRRSRRC